MADPREVQGADPDARRGLIAWFGRNPVAAYVLLFAVFVGGIMASGLIPVETFPKYDPGIVRVEVPYPGATPLEVEEDVVKRVEESLVGTIGIARIVSSSREELAVIEAEIDDYADPVDTLNSVRTAVERIEDFPPGNADQPEVSRVEVNRPVLTLAMTSDVLSAYDLRQSAESLRDDLLLLPGVAIIELFGTRDQEIQVEVSEETLRRYGLTVQDVVRVIRNTSVNVTGGELRTDSGEIILSTLARRGYAEEFADVVVIARADGSLVRLGDIAALRDGLLEQRVQTTLDGTPAVLLQLKVAPGTSPQQASAQVRGYLQDYATPAGTRLQVWADESWTVRESLDLVIQNGTFGLVLVFLTLLLVFDLRIAAWVTLGVPVIFVGALIFFPVFDLSINVITLFAFFILIALVVDDSIVAAESMAGARAQGLAGADASVAGVRRVLGPLVVAALTTAAAFAALLPLEGGIGQMFSAIPVVVGVVLLLSVLETSLVLPGHLARGGGTRSWPLSLVQDRLQASTEGSIQSRIVPLITWSVRRPFWPPMIVAAALVLAVIVLLVGAVRWVPTLSIADEPNIQADLVLPVDARLEDMIAATDAVVDAAGRMDAELGGNNVDGTVVVIGHRLPVGMYEGAAAGQYQANVASVQLRLTPSSERGQTRDALRLRWQRELAGLSGVSGLPGAESVAFPTRRSQPTGALSYALIHSDDDVLRDAAAWLNNAWSRMPGVAAVHDSLGPGSRRLEVRLNAAGHSAGLTAAGVASQLRDSFFGAEAQRIQRGREEVLVMVRYPGERRTSYADLLNERITLPGSREQVPLYTVAALQETGTRASRLRIDGRGAAVVTADLDLAADRSGDVAERTRAELLPRLQARSPGIEIRSHGASRDAERIVATLLFSVPVALIFIYGLIASFLRSFIQPLLVLAGIPIAFVGAVAGHWVLGYELTVTSIFGLIAVSGVVVNDTILLMHRYNAIRQELPDVPEIAAISAATQQRARAILLTSFTTVIGLLPILFSDAEAIRFLIPLVVSLTFGLIFAGVGLLLLLPSVLMLVELAKIRLRLPAVVAQAGT